MVNLFFVPSLKHIALNKIAIILCKRKDFLLRIPVNLNPKEAEKTNSIMQGWLKENELLIKELVNFQQIHSLTPQLLDIFTGIAYQIHYWKSSNRTNALFYEYVLGNYDSLQWTPNGEIDYPGTARTVVRDTSLNLHQRYYISCSHSFEEDISKLKSLIVDDSIPVFSYRTEADLAILLYWEHNGRLGPGLTFLDIFKAAVEGENISAMKYFYGKLSLSEKDAIFDVVQQVILKTKFDNDFRHTPTSFLLSLLSFLSEGDSVLTLSKYSFHILLFFITSPLRLHYREVLERVFPYLTVQDIYMLILHLTTKSESNLFSYEDIFEAVFLRCSRTMKRRLLGIIMKTDSLLKAMKINRKVRSLKLLLSFATRAQRLQIRAQTRRCFRNLRVTIADVQALLRNI